MALLVLLTPNHFKRILVALMMAPLLLPLIISVRFWVL